MVIFMKTGYTHNALSTLMVTKLVTAVRPLSVVDVSSTAHSNDALIVFVMLMETVGICVFR